MQSEASEPASVKNAKWLYVVSAIFSITCLVIIALIWHRVYYEPYVPLENETPMMSPEVVDHYLVAHITSPDSGTNIYIPTGVIIQSLEFSGPYTIRVSGYLWQRYSKDLPALDKGVFFPEASSSSITKAYETEQGNETLIGWYFTTTLREQFNYSHYPLDQQLVWLRMWGVEFEKNVYLKPDVEGYESLTPTMLPGIDHEVVLENWKLELSYFSYRLHSYRSNFGLRGYDPNIAEPELYFNVAIQRHILSPVFARGIAPLIILIQLFVIVLVIGSDSKRLDLFGVRPGAVIFTCAAFFFAILIAENSLRDEVKWYSIVYLESLHVITYFAILGVAANSVGLVFFPVSRFFGRDNLWVKVFYWPVIMLSFLIITLITFLPL